MRSETVTIKTKTPAKHLLSRYQLIKW